MRRKNRADGQRMYWTEREYTDDSTWKSQPYQYGKPIGNAGYHWLRNIKANDGEFYAEYQPNKGGANRKYYNLVTEKWEDKYIRLQACPTCQNLIDTVRPGTNKCPACGVETGYTY